MYYHPVKGLHFTSEPQKPFNSYSYSWGWGEVGGVVCRKKTSCPEHKTILTISIRMPGYPLFRTVLAREGCLDMLCSYYRHEASSVPWLLVLPGYCWNYKGKSTRPIGYTALLLQKHLQTFPTFISRTKFYPKWCFKILQFWKTTSINSWKKKIQGQQSGQGYSSLLIFKWKMGLGRYLSYTLRIHNLNE